MLGYNLKTFTTLGTAHKSCNSKVNLKTPHVLVTIQRLDHVHILDELHVTNTSFNTLYNLLQ